MMYEILQGSSQTLRKTSDVCFDMLKANASPGDLTVICFWPEGVSDACDTYAGFHRNFAVGCVLNDLFRLSQNWVGQLRRLRELMSQC